MQSESYQLHLYPDRFSSHAPLPAAGALYRGELPQGGPPELPQGGPDGSPPRGYGHEPPLPTAGGKFVSGQGAVLLGAMLPPPNLVRIRGLQS